MRYFLSYYTSNYKVKNLLHHCEVNPDYYLTLFGLSLCIFAHPMMFDVQKASCAQMEEVFRRMDDSKASAYNLIQKIIVRRDNMAWIFPSKRIAEIGFICIEELDNNTVSCMIY